MSSIEVELFLGSSGGGEILGICALSWSFKMISEIPVKSSKQTLCICKRWVKMAKDKTTNVQTHIINKKNLSPINKQLVNLSCACVLWNSAPLPRGSNVGSVFENLGFRASDSWEIIFYNKMYIFRWVTFKDIHFHQLQWDYPIWV